LGVSVDRTTHVSSLGSALSSSRPRHLNAVDVRACADDPHLQPFDAWVCHIGDEFFMSVTKEARASGIKDPSGDIVLPVDPVEVPPVSTFSREDDHAGQVTREG
jgi:hypothetical protein